MLSDRLSSNVCLHLMICITWRTPLLTATTRSMIRWTEKSLLDIQEKKKLHVKQLLLISFEINEEASGEGSQQNSIILWIFIGLLQRDGLIWAAFFTKFLENTHVQLKVQNDSTTLFILSFSSCQFQTCLQINKYWCHVKIRNPLAPHIYILSVRKSSELPPAKFL